MKASSRTWKTTAFANVAAAATDEQGDVGRRVCQAETTSVRARSCLVGHASSTFRASSQALLPARGGKCKRWPLAGRELSGSTWPSRAGSWPRSSRGWCTLTGSVARVLLPCWPPSRHTVLVTGPAKGLPSANTGGSHGRTRVWGLQLGHLSPAYLGDLGPLCARAPSSFK